MPRVNLFNQSNQRKFLLWLHFTEEEIDQKDGSAEFEFQIQTQAICISRSSQSNPEYMFKHLKSIYTFWYDNLHIKVVFEAELLPVPKSYGSVTTSLPWFLAQSLTSCKLQ